MADQSPDAYEKLVDRLLASDEYAERMALVWMDAARYGDTSVFHDDGPRDMWPWRDWVLNAYRDNKPFDEFTIEQIAGDLLPEASLEQKIASGFNRNHATTDEGGAIAEEFRVEYVIDRVKTTSNVWLGMTFECAQCHDHMYDPFSQKEYYQMFAFFNNNADPGMQTRRGNQAPLVEIMTPEREKQLADCGKCPSRMHGANLIPDASNPLTPLRIGFAQCSKDIKTNPGSPGARWTGGLLSLRPCRPGEQSIGPWGSRSHAHDFTGFPHQGGQCQVQERNKNRKKCLCRSSQLWRFRTQPILFFKCMGQTL